MKTMLAALIATSAVLGACGGKREATTPNKALEHKDDATGGAAYGGAAYGGHKPTPPANPCNSK